MCAISINDRMYSQNNAVSFKGTVDKSVTKYLKEVRTDIIAQRKVAGFEMTNSMRKKELIDTKDFISNIVTKLNKFMNKTHKDTKLILEPSLIGEQRNLIFENSKLGTRINAYKNGRLGFGQISTEGVGIIKPNIKNPEIQPGILNELFFKKQVPHTINEVKEFSHWTDALTDYVDPKKVDEALFDKMTESMAKKAENTSLIGRAITAHNAKKADKFAEEFGRKPNYKKVFENIAEQNAKKTERYKQSDIILAKEIDELKNLKI